MQSPLFRSIEMLRLAVTLFMRQYERHQQRLDENTCPVVEVDYTSCYQKYRIKIWYTTELAGYLEDDKREYLEEIVPLNVSDENLESLVDSLMERLVINKPIAA